MKKLSIVFATLFIALCQQAAAQTLDTGALRDFSPSTVRETFEVCRYAKLTPDQQVSLARAIDDENALFVKMIAGNNGVLAVRDRNRLTKMRDNTLRRLLDDETLLQYYRGLYDAEAMAEGTGVANELQKKYNLTDQNWKFIRIAFYKIALDSRVIRRMMADTPAKARKEIERIRREQLKTIEEKGGIRVNDDMTVDVVRPFDPVALRKE